VELLSPFLHCPFVKWTALSACCAQNRWYWIFDYWHWASFGVGIDFKALNHIVTQFQHWAHPCFNLTFTIQNKVHRCIWTVGKIKYFKVWISQYLTSNILFSKYWIIHRICIMWFISYVKTLKNLFFFVFFWIIYSFLNWGKNEILFFYNIFVYKSHWITMIADWSEVTKRKFKTRTLDPVKHLLKEYYSIWNLVQF
jgi:hypothetical protein